MHNLLVVFVFLCCNKFLGQRGFLGFKDAFYFCFFISQEPFQVFFLPFLVVNNYRQANIAVKNIKAGIKGHLQTNDYLQANLNLKRLKKPCGLGRKIFGPKDKTQRLAKKILQLDISLSKTNF